MRHWTHCVSLTLLTAALLGVSACADPGCPSGSVLVEKACRYVDAATTTDEAGALSGEDEDGGPHAASPSEGDSAAQPTARDGSTMSASDGAPHDAAGAMSGDAGAPGAGATMDASMLASDAGFDAGAAVGDASADAALTCAAGHVVKNGACQDVDECFEGTHQCHVTATCANTAGSHDCTCPLGYSGGTAAGFACAPRIAVGTSPSADSVHACVVLSDGTVSCWGGNDVGQLGDGTQVNRFDPAVVPRLSGVVLLVAGDRSTCVVQRTGEAKCWGANASGQLGTGTAMSRNDPGAVLQLEGVISIALGRAHACAVLTDGTAKCWGDNTKGQLGSSGVQSSSTPLGVRGINDGVLVFAGFDQSCVLRATGDALCWGSGALGESAGLSTSTAPISVAIPKDVASIAIGSFHACSVHRDRRVQCWGTPGLLGRPDGTPADALNAGPASSAGIMAYSTYVLTTDGVTSTWAAGTVTMVPGLPIAATLASGVLKLCVLARTGTVSCVSDAMVTNVPGLDLW